MDEFTTLANNLPFFLALCGAGAVAGITAGLFGNGGGFVIVPALITLFERHSHNSNELIYTAIGTSLACISVTTARAITAHRRRGAVDFDVITAWALWVFLGVLGGIGIARFVNAATLFYLFSAGVLVYSLYFLFPERFKPAKEPPPMPTGLPRAALACGLGTFSSLLGIGGGTVTVITMVTCGRTIHQAVATASGIGFVIGLTGAIGFLILGLGQGNILYGSVGYVNVPAWLLISALSIFTAPLGAGWAHSLDDRRLKQIFGIYLVFVSISMAFKGLNV